MASTGEVWRLGHRPALDGLRGLAVLVVVADHAGYLPEPAGSVGVTVFFVLSGFLISRVIIEAREAGRWSFGAFFGNRLARLLPALAVMVAGVSALWLALGFAPGLVAERAAKALLYGQNFYMSHDLGTPFRHTWSLAVEEQFYLAWPLVLPWVLRARRPLVALGWAVACSLLLRLAAFGTGLHELAQASLPTNAYALLLGCGMALAARSLPAARWVAPFGIVGLAAAIVVGPSLPAPHLLAPITGALCSVALVSGAANGNPALEVAPLRFVGRISYAWYLWHYPVIALFGTLHVRVTAAVVVSFVLAAASTLWLEEPIRRGWRSRLELRPDVPSPHVQHGIVRPVDHVSAIQGAKA